MPILDDFRQQNPQYGDIPDAALADTLYSKFYSDIPRGEFDKRLNIAPRMISDEQVAQDLINRDAAAQQPKPQGREGGIIQSVPRATELLGTEEGRAKLIEALKRYPGEFVTGMVDLLAAPGKAAQGKLSPDEELAAGINLGLAAVLRPSGSPFRGLRRAEVGPAVPNAAAPQAGVNPLEGLLAEAERTFGPRGEPVSAAKPATGSIEALAQEAKAADATAAASEPAQSKLAGQAIDDLARTQAQADRASTAAPDRAANINLDRVYAPDDVKAVIKQTAADNAEFLPARRGKITQAETREMAQLLGMSAEDLATRKIGQAFNAEEMLAARDLLVTQATKVRDLASLARGGSDIQRAEFAQEMTRLVAIQEQVSGATAEAGRALAQFRMLSGASREEIARIVEASKTSGIDDMARKVAELDDPAKVAAYASNAFKAKTSDMLLEGWINALLSGPTTHGANILSNALVSAWSIPESATAAAISKLTGSGIAGREALGRAFGVLEGIKDGIPAAWRAFRTEQPSDLASKIETRNYRSIPSANVFGVEIGGKQVRIPGRLLMAEDEVFKAIGYSQELNAQAMRQALSENLSGRALAARVSELKANPTTAMREAARATAEKQTFTNPLGPAGIALQTMAREVPALRVVMPFIRTPINIVKFAAERSPFAPLFKEVRANLRGENGAIARDNQIARIGLGSAVSAATAYMAVQGHITGGGPADAHKRALLYADGWQPYSVKLGGSYYSFSRFEPMGTLMGVAADMVELQKTMTTDEKTNIAALMMGSVSRNLVSKTWLKGPSDLLEAIHDPQRNGPHYIQRLAGSLVPAGVAQYAQNSDPFLREARTVMDAIRARIPGEREKLFIRRDVFGEQVKREGPLGPDLLSPVYQSAARNDATIAELLRLKVTPGQLPRTVRNAELTDAEFDFYSKAAGQNMKGALDTLVALPQWRDLPEVVQVEAFHDVIRKARDVARTQLISQFPDLPLRIAADTLKRKRISTSTTD